MNYASRLGETVTPEIIAKIREIVLGDPKVNLSELVHIIGIFKNA